MSQAPASPPRMPAVSYLDADLRPDSQLGQARRAHPARASGCNESSRSVKPRWLRARAHVKITASAARRGACARNETTERASAYAADRTSLGARYQLLVRGRLSGTCTRTRASTAMQPSGRARTGFRSSSETAGKSSPRRDKRQTRSTSEATSAAGWPRNPLTSLPALPVVTSSSASMSVSGAIRKAASPINSAKTPPGPKATRGPKTGS